MSDAKYDLMTNILPFSIQVNCVGQCKSGCWRIIKTKRESLCVGLEGI